VNGIRLAAKRSGLCHDRSFRRRPRECQQGRFPSRPRGPDGTFLPSGSAAVRVRGQLHSAASAAGGPLPSCYGRWSRWSMRWSSERRRRSRRIRESPIASMRQANPGDTRGRRAAGHVLRTEVRLAAPGGIGTLQ